MEEGEKCLSVEVWEPCISISDHGYENNMMPRLNRNTE
jgi:hypothetical protein